MIDATEIKSRAIGNWKGIITALGVSPNYLTGKHSPCPLCGGKDRFRFSDYHGNGDYICNQCGNGDGFSLLMAINGYSFAEACEAVANLLGYDPTTFRPTTFRRSGRVNRSGRINTKAPLKTPERPHKPFLADKQVNHTKRQPKRPKSHSTRRKVDNPTFSQWKIFKQSRA